MKLRHSLAFEVTRNAFTVVFMFRNTMPVHILGKSILPEDGTQAFNIFSFLTLTNLSFESAIAAPPVALFHRKVKGKVKSVPTACQASS